MRNLIGKWCCSIDEETFNETFDTETKAHIHAKEELDDAISEHQNGDEFSYWIGQCCHPLDKLTSQFKDGSITLRLVDQIDEWLYDIISADEQILFIDEESSKELGIMIYNFLKEKATFSIYAVENLTEHTHVIGSTYE